MMMMKLMKFLVVALVAGGVCAPTLSQAGEVDGKALMCKRSFGLDTRELFTDEQKAQGLHLLALHFVSDRVEYIYPSLLEERRYIKRVMGTRIYRAETAYISWFNYRLDRKTLEVQRLGRDNLQCELIDPDKIDAYLQPYVDYGNAVDAKRRSENKI